MKEKQEKTKTQNSRKERNLNRVVLEVLDIQIKISETYGEI